MTALTASPISVSLAQGWRPAFAALFATALLAACGGGGGSAETATPTPPVTAPAVTPASIGVQPADQSVLAGASATFSVTASGDGLAYQWQRSSDNGSTWAAISGANAAVFTVAAADASVNGSRYRAVVSGSANSVTSSAATLTVNTVVIAPTISVDVAAQSVTAGGSAVFTVTVAGSSPAFQWQVSNDGTTFTSIAGATASTLTLTSLTVADGGRFYRVVVSNSAGSVTSSTALLTVNAAPMLPVITTAPVAVSVTVPGPASFSVAATGTPAPTYLWQTSIDGGTTWASAASTASYTTAALTVANSGTLVRVIVSNSAGSAISTPVALTVNAAPVAPLIGTPPVAATVTAPAVASFSVAATGTPSPGFQWQVSTDGGVSFANITGATAASYSTPATSIADSGKRYRVVVSNSAGSATSGAVALTVNIATVAPVITGQSSGSTVTAPSTATFTVAATGTPLPTYQWQRSTDGGLTYAAIDGATAAAYTTPATVVADNGTRFRVVVSNSAGLVTSAAIVLTVNVANVSPSITTSPTAAFVTVPSAATFSIVASGTPAPTYQWQISTDGGSNFSNITGATAASYTTPATTLADNGSYFRVRVTNSAGGLVTGPLLLTVAAAVDPSALPPAIAGDPAFSSRCDATPAAARIGPFSTQTGDCFVSYTITDAELAAYQANYNTAPIRMTVLNAVRANFKDRVDAVFVILDSDSSQRGSLPFGINYGVQNCSVHDPSCPRFARLGNVWLTARTDLQNGPSLHELLHGFHNGMAPNGTTGFIVPTTVDAHWGFSSAGGQLGGWDKASLVSLGGGSYRARAPLPPANYGQPSSFGINANGGNSIPYSNLELWTMGLIPDAELLAVDVAENASFTANGVFSASAIRSYAPAEIIARVLTTGRPSTSTPRAFRALVVFATTRATLDAATVSALNSDIEQFTLRAPTTAWSGLYNVFTGTGRRMTLQMATASELAR